MRFRAGQRLIDREDTIEFLRADPFFLLHQLLADHGDLCKGSAPGEEAKSQEAQKDTGVGLVWNIDVCIRVGVQCDLICLSD